MTSSKPTVTAIISFLNTPVEFLKEAVESVLAQSYDDWELLLVDDGSTDQSSHLAQRYADRCSNRIRYLEHEYHENRGLSAARNLGISHARGEYVAFLDADDVWFPGKLATQIAIFESIPGAGMVYGNSQYWYSWSGNPKDLKRDKVSKLGVPRDVLYEPPVLLPLFLRRRAIVPSMSNVLVRRHVLEATGRFDNTFKTLYEDQVFYAKMALNVPIYASGDCWDRYRQHPDSLCSVADILRERQARLTYLKWLGKYLRSHDLRSADVVEALRKELWIWESLGPVPVSPSTFNKLRLTKKWLLRLQELILPTPIDRWLWTSRSGGLCRSHGNNTK